MGGIFWKTYSFYGVHQLIPNNLWIPSRIMDLIWTKSWRGMLSKVSVVLRHSNMRHVPATRHHGGLRVKRCQREIWPDIEAQSLFPVCIGVGFLCGWKKKHDTNIFVNSTFLISINFFWFMKKEVFSDDGATLSANNTRDILYQTITPVIWL